MVLLRSVSNGNTKILDGLFQASLINNDSNVAEENRRLHSDLPLKNLAEIWLVSSSRHMSLLLQEYIIFWKPCVWGNHLKMSALGS